MEYLPSFRDDLHADIKPSFIAHSFRDEHDAKMMYGLPKVKKFPMPDAKHVRSAIRFFNYAKPSQERALANAILARMDDYGINPNDINVGDDNRFKKYLQHSYLAHHGIKGMHWGIRRYQNPDGSYTKRGLVRHRQNRKILNSDNLKTAAKVAGAVGATALVGAGAYAVYKNSKSADGNFKTNIDPNFLNQDKKQKSMQSGFKTINSPHTLEDDFLNNNIGYGNGPEYESNCTECAMSYELRRRGFDVHPTGNLFGKSAKELRKWFKDADIQTVGVPEYNDFKKWLDDNEKNNSSWKHLPKDRLADTKSREMRLKDFQDLGFFIREDDPKAYYAFQQRTVDQMLDVCKKHGPNARGIIQLNWANGGGHSISFENDSRGNPIILDTQLLNRRDRGSRYVNKVLRNEVDPFVPIDIIRTDTAEIDYDYLRQTNVVTDDADKVLY